VLIENSTGFNKVDSFDLLAEVNKSTCCSQQEKGVDDMCSKVNTNIYMKSEHILIITVSIESTSTETLLACKRQAWQTTKFSKQKHLRKAMIFFYSSINKIRSIQLKQWLDPSHLFYSNNICLDERNES